MSAKKTTKDPLLEEETEEAVKAEKETKPKETKAPVLEKEEKKVAPAKSEYRAIIADTKAILDKKPKVNFIVPLSPGEPEDAVDIVQINGYKMTVKKGTMVSIPVPVANILAEKYKINLEAGKAMRVDRATDVQERLS